jgi:hypothetical protein
MPFSLYPHMSPIDVYVMLNSALPAIWIGFAELGAAAMRRQSVSLACFSPDSTRHQSPLRCASHA